MLSKEACKDCYQKTFDDKFVRYNDRVLWGEKEERDWKSGFLVCFKNLGLVITDEPPPPGCPYALEHMMEDQKC